MKRAYFISLLVGLALVLTPLLVLAQDDDEFEEFESEDGLLTLSYPADWMVVEQYWFAPVFMAGSSEHALEQLQSDDVMMPESGDVMLFVTLAPTDMFVMMGMELDPDAPFADLTTEVATIFLTPEDPDPEYMLEIGEAEEIELDDDLTVGYVEFEENYDYGALILRPLGDDLLVITLIGTPSDEFSEDIADLGKQVAASVAYDGTSADLLAAMMAEPEIEEAPEGVTAADLDGEALIDERCSVCHSTAQIYNASKNEAGWTATVDRMIGYGADLNTAEREAVIAYLAGM